MLAGGHPARLTPRRRFCPAVLLAAHWFLPAHYAAAPLASFHQRVCRIHATTTCRRRHRIFACARARTWERRQPSLPVPLGLNGLACVLLASPPTSAPTATSLTALLPHGGLFFFRSRDNVKLRTQYSLTDHSMAAPCLYRAFRSSPFYLPHATNHPVLLPNAWRQRRAAMRRGVSAYRKRQQAA